MVNKMVCDYGDARGEETQFPYHVSKRRHIQQPDYGAEYQLSSAFKKLSRLRRGAMFCDVTLVADDGDIDAHRVILASRCSYFRAMFMCGTRESWDRNVRLRDMSHDTLNVVVQHLYNEKVNITVDNVQDVLSAAEMMDLSELKRMALRFMTSNVNANNCLAIWQVSDLFSCNIAAEEAKTYALKNFVDVIETQSYLELSPTHLNTLLSHDLLRSDNERVVYDGLTKWYQHNPHERQPYMSALLQSIRFHAFHSEDLVRVMSEQKLMEANPLLQEVLLYRVEQPHSGRVCTVPGPPINPSRRKVISQLAVVVGGHQENSIWSPTWGFEIPSNISTNINAKERGRWYSMPSPYTQRRDHAAIGTGTNVIVAGGSDGHNQLNSVERYDAYTGQWQELPGMLTTRNHLGGTQVQGKVYVAGGTNDSSPYLNTVEVLDLGTSRWLMCPALNTARRSCAATTLQGQMVVAGGAGKHSADLNTVEFYDPREPHWRKGPHLKLGRRGCSLVVANGDMFAMGGYNTPQGYTSSVERYDLRTNSWMTYGDIPIRTGYFGATVTRSNQVLVCGGVSNDSLLLWDPVTKTSRVISDASPPLPYSGTVTVCGDLPL